MRYLNVCEPVHDDHLQRHLPHLVSSTLSFKRASYLTGSKTFIQVMIQEPKGIFGLQLSEKAIYQDTAST